MSESVREYFGAYAEYIGCKVEELDEYGLDLWDCDACDVTVPVSASDPQAYGPVLCPECGELCEVRGDE